MFDLLISPFSEFEFMRRALVGCLAISVSAAPIGVFLMLRRMSLTGDAMAHAILPGAAIGFLIAGLSIEAMTIGGIVAGCLVAVLSGVVSRSTDVAEDSSMAAFYLISLALGVLIISVKGSQVDLLHVLFGSALGLNDDALMLLVVICTVSLVSLALLFRPLVVECMDRLFLQSVSKLSPIAHLCFLVLVVLNLVGGFNALGTLMSVGMMILPAAIIRYWARKLDMMLLGSVFVAFFSCLLGLLASYYFALPSGPAIILSLGAAYILSFIFGFNGGLLSKLRKHKKHLAA
jgi:zinc/manganese transport system permease protein